MASLPKDIVDDYLDKHHTPEILSKEYIQAHSETIQDLLAYCETLIDFLEKNEIYENPYPIKAATFEPFHSTLAQYYKTLADPDQLLSLLRVEQTIHLVTHTVNTQDISPYLAILEILCDGNHLNELVLLLSKKHCASSKGFTSNYRKWIKFLEPYIRFLVKMDFDYFKIFHLNSSDKDILLKDYLSELREFLSKRGITIDCSEAPDRIKKEFLTNALNKDEDSYYYEFGLIMFVLQLTTSYPEGGNSDFFKVCIALESYAGSSSSVHLKKGMIEQEYLDALKSSERDVFAQGAKKLFASISLERLDLLGSVLEIFLKTNVFYEENETLEKILKTAATPPENNHQSHYYGLTHYEYLVRLVLVIVYKGIHFKFPTPEQKEKFFEFAKTLFEKDLLETKRLRPYIKDKYYDVLRLLTSPTKFVETWNLSKVPLADMITRQDFQHEDLFLNLKFSLKFMVAKSLPDKDQIKALGDTLRIYISTIETYKSPSSSEQQLKIISTFLLKIFSLNNTMFPKDLKIQFLHSFTNFIANKCSSVNEWDVIDFQADYWKTLQSTSSTKTVVLEKAFQKFFEIVEENLAKAGIEVNCEYQDRSYIREAEIAARFDHLVLASLERIESSLTTQWLLISWKNALDPQILKLKLDCKTFIYSTQKWLVYLLDNNKFQHDDAFSPRFTNILFKSSHLYFHPAFLLLTETIEQKKFLEAYSKIVDQNKFIRWNARIVFFGTLGHRVTFLNRMFHSDIKSHLSREQVLQLDIQEIREDLFSRKKNLSLNKETILFVAILKRISQLPGILRGFDGCGINEAAQNQYIDMLKKLSTPLIEFILNVYSVGTNGSLDSDPLFCAIIKGLDGLLKPPHSVVNAFPAIQSFFCQLLQNGFRNNNSNIPRKMLKMILILNDMLKGRLKDALLCSVICQGTPLSQIIQVTSDHIDYKIGKTSNPPVSENDMKMIHKLALHLADYFMIYFKTIVKTLEAFNYGISSQDVEKHLFNLLLKTLNSLQAQEIILYQNTQTDQIFASVLQILEKCFITLKKDVIKAIMPIQDEIVSLESNLTEDYQNFESLFGDDDEPTTNNVAILNVEEVNQKIKDEIALKKKELEKTRGEADEIDKQFFHSLPYFVLIYPFAEAKKTWSSILAPIQEKSLNELTQLLNNLIQNISTQSGLIKVLNFTPDHSLNKLLTIQGCLNRLLAFLQRPEGDYSVQESFIWSLVEGTTILFSDSHQDLDRFVETIQGLIANTCKLILTYSTCKYLSNSAQAFLEQNQLKSFSQWLRTTVNFYCLLSEHPHSKISIDNDPTILDIFGLIQIFSSDSLDFTDLISTILNTKTKKSWTVTLTYFIACALEKPLQEGLPEDLLIQTQIKKLLSRSASRTLPMSNLVYDPLIAEKEITSREKLIAISENKFKISQNVNISFDLNQEDPSSQSSVESVLSRISPDVQKILKTLMDSILNNHLFNLQHHKENLFLFKETNSIMTVISILAQKFSYIAAYIAFFKEDYSHLFNNSSEFKSITFLECLFKLKFFRYNGHSFLLLLKPLTASMGIVFRDPESPDTLIDVSAIVTTRCLELIQEEVKDLLENQDDLLSSTERYLISKFSIAALGYINFVTQQNSTKSKLFYHIGSLLNDVLKSILQSLKFLFRNPCIQNSIIEDILSGLHTNFFESQYSKFCSEISVSSPRIDALKTDHYQEFLTNVDSSNTSNKLSEMMKTNLNIQVTTLNPSNSQYKINLEKPYLQSRYINIFKRENNKNEANAFPFNMASSIYGNVTWINCLTSLNSNIPSHAATTKLELPTERSEFNLPNLFSVKSVSFLDVQKTLLKIGMLSQSTTDTSFYHEISQKLIQQATLQNQHQEIKVEDKATIIIPNAHQQQQSKPLIKSLKYFINLSIKSETDFLNAETQAKIKIKFITERILVETLPLIEATTSLTQLVLEELSKMDEFERNLVLCHMSQYPIFISFEFPRNFTEIFEEFTWIHQNIKTYLEILQELSPQSSIPPPSSQILHVENLESLDELTFCKSYDLDVPPTGQSLIPSFDQNLKNNLHRFHNLYFFDENVVESLASSFYLVFSNETPAQLTGLLNELCNSPPFQVKLIDFCFFFLYSPDHLASLDQADLFPYDTICDSKSRSTLPLNQNWDKVMKNVLKFLLQHIRHRIYLVCQPKVYLDQYGLKNIQELKPKTNYQKVTKDFISIGDLLVGLLGIEEINSNTSLLQELQSLLKTVFTQKVQFKIWDTKNDDDMPIGEKKMLTVKSCKAILKMSSIDVILKDLDHIAIYDFEIPLQNLTEKIAALQKPVDQINTYLKSCGADPTENGLKPLFDLTKNFESLEEIFTFICSLFLTWDSAEKEKSIQIKQQKDNVYIKALNHLASQVLTEPTVEDFIIHLFELLNYLASPTLGPFKQVALVLPTLMRSCLQYYAILCFKNKILEKQIQETSEEGTLDLPKFTQIVSCENVKERDTLPGLGEKTYSSLRRSREFDFDILITEMCKKHQNNLEKAFYLKNKKSEAIGFLSQRVPWILDFTLKYKIFMYFLRYSCINHRLREAVNEDLRITGCNSTRSLIIDRKKLVQSALQQFSNVSHKDLRKRITVSFQGEHGSDAGGVRREWYTIICQELFNPDFGLFEISKNGFNIQPSPLSAIIPYRLKYFQLAGIVLAKALQEGFVVDLNFTKPFLKQILINRNLAINDLADIDAELYKSLEWILNNSVDELEQNFTYDIQIFENNITKELLENGYDKIMNDENKKEFVKRLCQAKMQGEIEQELSAFLEGFYLILPKQCLDIFSPSELQLLISGAPKIEIEHIKDKVNYSGYTADHDVMKWLWEILEEFSQKELAAFVFFVTGSLRIPVGQKRTFTFSQHPYGATRLPVSHTCSWHIEIPPYATKEEFKLKLLMAIYDGQGSFMLS